MKTLADFCNLMCNDCGVQLIITVQDMNDNKPEFETSQYLTTVPENLPIDSSVTEGLYSRGLKGFECCSRFVLSWIERLWVLI